MSNDQYDDTDKGAVFKPFDKQKFILQGKVNSKGYEKNVVLITDEARSGKRYINVYAKVGVLFENDSDNEKAPHYTGKLEVGGQNERWLSAWKRQSENGNKFMSLAVSDPRSRDDAPTGSGGGADAGNNDLDDNLVPF